MEIRAVTRYDRDEWARMREALYPDPPVSEIDAWLDAMDAGGTHPVGVAVFVADRGNGMLAGLRFFETLVSLRARLASNACCPAS